MHNLDITYVEKVGNNFKLPDYMKVRDLTIKIVSEIAKRVEVGMSEDDGLAIANEVMLKHEILKRWHPTKFRIGCNTVKSFREKSDIEVRLQKNDIFFIDIGPIVNGYEGDFGRTFTIGENKDYRQVKLAVEQVFKKVQSFYINRPHQSGAQLYEYAASQAKQLGYELNIKTAGHRLGDFPHALYYKGKLKEIENVKIAHPQLWVLEIQIQHPHRSFGAFYEDVLSV